MTDKEFTKTIAELSGDVRKVSLGIDVLTEFVSSLGLQITEAEIRNEKIMALLKQTLVASGIDNQAIEDQLLAIDQEARRRIVDQQQRALKSSYGNTPPPLDQSN